MNVPFKIYLQNLFLDMKLGAYLADLCPSMPDAHLTTVTTLGVFSDPP